MENEEWPEGGVFDDSDTEGVFEDEESIFDDEGSVDHANPVTTRAQETMVSALPGTPAPAPARQLVAVFGADGSPKVAYAIDGQPQEQFRAPSQQELVMLKERGRLVQGSVENTAPAAVGAVAPSGSFLTRNASLLGGLAAVAVGARVYFYQKKKREKARPMEELDVFSEDFTEDAGARSVALVPDEIEY
jgi:hypothetical protein